MTSDIRPSIASVRRRDPARLCATLRLFIAPLVAALLVCGCSRGGKQAAETMAQAARTVAYVDPNQLEVQQILIREAEKAAPTVAQVINTADELVRKGVRYRFDDKDHELDRQQTKVFQPELSCSEFAWYVFSRAGLDLGDQHLQTRDLAFREGAYAPAMERVIDGSIKPGDLLVYSQPLDELKREQKLTGKWPSGHAVIVVSADEKIVVGSHFYKSTPTGAPTGAGYRKLLSGWVQWTDHRTLRAVYRIKNGWRTPTPATPAPQPIHSLPPSSLAGK